MLNGSHCKRLLTACISCLLLLLHFPLSANEGTTPKPVEISKETPPIVTVGVVPQFDQRHIQTIWRPILDAIEQRTGIKFELRGAATIPAFERELLQGSYDLAYINPYQVVKIKEKLGYLPLVRDIAIDLKGIIVVSQNSPIQSIEELREQELAFPAPNALGASLLIRAELSDRHGIKIIPRYVLSHSSVYLNVALEEAVAGGGVQKTLEQQSAELKNLLKTLYTTEAVPSHPIVINPRVPESLRHKIKEAFLALGRDALGHELLSAVPITEIGPASIRDYRGLAEMGLERFH